MTSRRTPTKLDRFIAKRKSRWPCDASVIHARFARDEILNLAARRSAPRFARNKRYLCNPSCDRENQYKKYRNKSTCSLRATKRIYYAKKLEECKSNMKSTLSILNEVINNKKSKSILTTTFNVDDKEISDPTQTADNFCVNFTNIDLILVSLLTVLFFLELL